MKPRGIRSNNPGNIREAPGDKTKWVGERATNDDPAFEEFETPEHGIRALAKVIQNYHRKYGINTVAEIISRWAPANENDTRAYIETVCKRTGLGHRQIDPMHYPTMKLLIEAIVHHENGCQPYTGDTIEAGLRLAGVKP